MMTQAINSSDLRLDSPLEPNTALSTDLLDRRDFAEKVVVALRRISSYSSLVVSIEGSWGTGKTSALAMVEALLREEEKASRPIVVHFNPWLIGDRDSLLRHFLSSIAKAIEHVDYAKQAKGVSKTLKAYSSALDVVKLIPGAEPWASIVKSVLESTGKASEALADYKTPDIEARKIALEKALRKFPRRIVVLIDDLDRLYPAEVYEMVRIVKAVGELPNVGYVLAWDEKYISAALDKLNVPLASTYLDKIVQLRFHLPPLSFPQLSFLMEQGLSRLNPSALEDYFHSKENRLGNLYFNGLSDLIENPRDVARLFDTVSSLEPSLRGEIHIADIVGLASLMLKAPAVHELIRKSPQSFIGKKPGASLGISDADKVVNEAKKSRDAAIDASSNPESVRKVVHVLFPKTQKSDNGASYENTSYLEGHIAHSERLLVALHLSKKLDDLSLVNVRKFIIEPSARNSIGAELTEKNCVNFVEAVGSFISATSDNLQFNRIELALAIANLIEHKSFAKRARNRTDVFDLDASAAAWRTIKIVGQRLSADERAKLASELICSPSALSIAAEVADSSFHASEEEGKTESDALEIKAPLSEAPTILKAFAKNIQSSAANGELFEKVATNDILWIAAKLTSEQQCGAIFKRISSNEHQLDLFVENMMRRGFSSAGGQAYGPPKHPELLEKFVPKDKLMELAANRLQDIYLPFPLKAAWKAFYEGNILWGSNGKVKKIED